MNTMTLRVYKNEYQPNQIVFLSSTFNVVDESETILTIQGTQDGLERVMSGMFCNDDQFKTVFPEYVTMTERRAIAQNELMALQDTIATTLCHCIRDGAMDSELFAKYRTFYLNEIAN